MNQSIHMDDVGTVFELTIINPVDGRPLNISDATDLAIIFQVPPASVDSAPTRLEVAATFSADGSDGRIQYVSQPGDLSVAGGWKIQAKVTTPDGEWHSEIVRFKVEDNL